MFKVNRANKIEKKWNEVYSQTYHKRQKLNIIPESQVANLTYTNVEEIKGC